jgi:hypothetical protein
MRSILLAAAAAAAVAGSAHAWEQMEARPPVFVPHGPFMVAVDPNGIIVNSQRPMILYPKEFSAMAQETAPLTADCPRPTAQEDKECNKTKPLPRSRPK